MKIGLNSFNNVARKTITSLPLRRELLIARSLVADRGRKVKVGLNIGFGSAGVNRVFSLLDTYWISVEFTRSLHDLVAAVIGPDSVALLGSNAQIPFEDKQFDTVVVSSTSIFYEGFTLSELIRECHRVLDTGGLFVLTLPRRKFFGFARRLGGVRGRIEMEHSCTEKEIFELLKRGYDVLGVRYHSRFFVQFARELLEKDGSSNEFSLPDWVVRLLYGIAACMDHLLIFCRRYNITVCARRKGWRGKQGGLVNDHTAVVSNAMFYDVKNERKTFSLARFKGDDQN
ncbi:MAG: methyltransferase domain-containing protein [Kiritimatiellia bacterium]